MDRPQATKVLNNYWASVDIYDRKYYETGDINYKVQADLLRKNCIEIMQRVTDAEKSAKDRT